MSGGWHLVLGVVVLNAGPPPGDSTLRKSRSIRTTA